MSLAYAAFRADAMRRPGANFIFLMDRKPALAS